MNQAGMLSGRLQSRRVITSSAELPDRLDKSGHEAYNKLSPDIPFFDITLSQHLVHAGVLWIAREFSLTWIEVVNC